MVCDFSQKLGLDTPLIRRRRPVEYRMLDMDRFICKLVGFNDAWFILVSKQALFQVNVGRHTKSANHSNDESALCLLCILAYLNLTAFDSRVFVFFTGSSFENR